MIEIGDPCIMIPGGGHGGWAWRPVAERLCAAGQQAIPVTLPGMNPCDDKRGIGIADAVEHVVAEIDRRGLDRVSLVAHSLGGVVLAALAARLGERATELVAVSAYIPLPGESFSTANSGSAVSRSVDTSSDEPTQPASLDRFAEISMQDYPAEAQRIIHDLMTPTPSRYSTDLYDGPDLATTGRPARYIAGRDDKALVRPADELAGRLGVTPVFVPGPHEALLTNPDEVAAAILA